MGSIPRSVYFGLSLILLTCFIIAVQGQIPTRHFLRRPLPQLPHPDSEFHQSSLTHIKVTSNIPVRSRSGLRPPSRRLPQPARELNYIQNRHPYDTNRRPYDTNRRPYDTNRRLYDTIRHPYDTNRHHPQNPFQRHDHLRDQRPYLPQPPVHVGPYPTVRGRVYPLPPPYTTIRHCNRNQQCPSGKTLDYNQCKCVCIVQVTTCPGAMNYNSDTCKCECSSRLVCNQYQRRNDAQCRCDPIHSPPTTTVTTSSCPATSRYLCSPRQILNLRTCQCQCPRFSANRCSSLQVLDERTCQCVCQNRSGRCPYGKIMNRNTCQCECPVTLTIRCYYPRRMDPNTCSCR